MSEDDKRIQIIDLSNATQHEKIEYVHNAMKSENCIVVCCEDDVSKIKSMLGDKLNANIKEDVEVFNEVDVELVMTQCNGVTREQAIMSLKRNNGDIVNTILDLTM